MKTSTVFKEKIAGMEELKGVEERLMEATRTSSALTKELSRHLLWRGGKRLRPLLVVLCASFGPHSREVLLDTAAASELIHTASLIHDDIIDEADKRRGDESLNYMWGNKWAVLTGDFLFSRAFTLLTRHVSLGVLEPMTKAIGLMCEGEIEQLGWSQDNKIPSEKEYFQYIYKKTAFLISACCLTGARVAALKEEKARALRTYGYHLGMAFQLIDDILDLMPDNDSLGKPAGSDIRQKVITLPLLNLMKDPSHNIFVSQLLARDNLLDEEVEALAKIARSSGALKAARDTAESHIMEARSCLKALDGHESRDHLGHLAEYILSRKN